MTYYSSYEQERQRRAAEWEGAPKQCPHCQAPINQQPPSYSEKIRYHCGSARCRKAASRATLAERKRRERDDTRKEILNYCNQHLHRDQRLMVMNMCDMLMKYSYEEGHQIAAKIVQIIEDRRCKHDRIAQIEEYAAIWKRKAAATEQQLKARIEELETELAMFNALEVTIHSIAQRQLQQQPDPSAQPLPPEPEPEDEDRAQVLATLKKAGLMSIEEAQAAGQWEDDTENYEGEYDEDK